MLKFFCSSIMYGSLNILAFASMKNLITINPI